MSFVLTSRDFKRSILTWVVIGLNVFVYLLVNIILDFFLGYSTTFFLAQNNYLIWQGEHIWGLFTSMFVHSGFLHLLFNMISLLLFGMMAEKFFTKAQWLLLYIGSGFFGSLASLFLYPVFTIGLGASGAIYGLMAAMFLFIPRDNLRLMIFGVIYVFISISRSLGNWAHLFGFLAGFLIGWYIKRHPPSLSQRKKRKKPNLRWKFSLWITTLRDRRFFRKEKRLAKKMNLEGEEKYSPPSTSDSEQDLHTKEINLLRKFHSRMNNSPTASYTQLSLVLDLGRPELTEKLLVWHQKIPFQMFDQAIKVERIHQFNAILDEIFFKWEEKHPSS